MTNQILEINCKEFSSFYPDLNIIGKKLEKTTIYFFPQKMFEWKIGEFSRILSCDELERAYSFRFERDIKNYVICRGVLRHIISNEINKAPGELIIRNGLNNKPYLEGNELFFNVSHTKEHTAIAISEKNNVGVDIEKINNDVDFMNISSAYFTPEEHTQLNNSPHPLNRFFLLWTRKEALLKSIGLGLSTDFREINVGHKINYIDYKHLCKYHQVDVNQKYYIYSKKINGHFLSLAIDTETKPEIINLSNKMLFFKDLN